jgi:hypothetical protein
MPLATPPPPPPAPPIAAEVRSHFGVLRRGTERAVVARGRGWKAVLTLRPHVGAPV